MFLFLFCHGITHPDGAAWRLTQTPAAAVSQLSSQEFWQDKTQKLKRENFVINPSYTMSELSNELEQASGFNVLFLHSQQSTYAYAEYV